MPGRRWRRSSVSGAEDHVCRLTIGLKETCLRFGVGSPHPPVRGVGPLLGRLRPSARVSVRARGVGRAGVPTLSIEVRNAAAQALDGNVGLPPRPRKVGHAGPRAVEALAADAGNAGPARAHYPTSTNEAGGDLRLEPDMNVRLPPREVGHAGPRALEALAADTGDAGPARAHYPTSTNEAGGDPRFGPDTNVRLPPREVGHAGPRALEALAADTGDAGPARAHYPTSTNEAGGVFLNSASISAVSQNGGRSS